MNFGVRHVFNIIVVKKKAWREEVGVIMWYNKYTYFPNPEIP